MKDNATTKENLINCAQEAWDSLEDDLLNELALSMQNRSDAVKAVNG